ncbi:hypothetical protein WOLCODRAFT_28445 [Wolfiporia cocos MD-104 SS10]|uniref:BTB domain-containing protein n=1 Tax=Wolfiporia cocos (strain MD-104) TaxID=742152 RepID=A0A2H3JHW8_WOLCO|nr:hypothetical protein WOLCODRAFT_28445 [Wolfiporia cocos MD-104 SS10]
MLSTELAMDSAERHESTPQITDAPAPFNKSTADIILRSSDLVDFRVRRAILAEVSPVFDTMSTLPQPTRGGRITVTRDGLPVIALEESSETLETILRFCYPLLPQPTIHGVERLYSVTKAVKKYAMDEVLPLVHTQLHSIAEEEPLRVYVFAIREGWEAEARLAARSSLSRDVHDLAWVPELKEISASAYHHLLDFHHRCCIAAKDVTTEYDRWITDSKVWGWFTIVNHDCHDCEKQYTRLWREVTRPRVKVGASQWWIDHMSRIADIMGTTPSMKKLLDQEIVDQTLVEASACSECRKSAPAQMRAFVKLHAAQVDEEISKVILKID